MNVCLTFIPIRLWCADQGRWKLRAVMRNMYVHYRLGVLAGMWSNGLRPDSDRGPGVSIWLLVKLSLAMEPSFYFLFLFGGLSQEVIVLVGVESNNFHRWYGICSPAGGSSCSPSLFCLDSRVQSAQGLLLTFLRSGCLLLGCFVKSVWYYP